MAKIAYIFPGQGAQFIGMGHDVYESSPVARDIFEQARKILNIDIADICFRGPKARLDQTQISQPAIFTTCAAIYKALQEKIRQLKLENKIFPAATGGLSLGEYTSLYISDCLNFETTLKLINLRANLMQEACLENQGGMVSIVGLDFEKVYEICKATNCEVANLNSHQQMVISGRKSNLEKAAKLAYEKGAKKVIILEVSGAFHSSFMDKASQGLKLYLDKIDFKPPRTLLVSNVTGRYHINPEEIKYNLYHQINHKTNWLECVNLMMDTGITIYLEIGPGKILRGLLRRIEPSLVVYNIQTTPDIENFIDDFMSQNDYGF